MDKRFFLALLLTMGVIVVTPRLFPGPARVAPPTTAVAPDSAPTSAPAASAATGAGASTITPSAVGPATAPTATPPAAPVESRVITLQNGLASYRLSSRGAALVDAELGRFRRLGRDSGAVRLADGARPLLGYRVIAGGDTVALDQAEFTVDGSALGDRRASFVTPIGGGTARVTYDLAPDDYRFDVSVDIGGVPAPAFLLVDLPRGFDTQERDSADDRRHLAYAMRSGVRGAERVDFRKPDPGERLVYDGPFTWAVAKNKYFLVGVISADSTAPAFAQVHVTGAMRVNKVALQAEGTAIARLEGAPIRFELYAGPQEWERLVARGREFEHANPYGGWFSGVVQPFATIVMRILLWMRRTLGLEYGWILVVFGVAIRLLMWPLNSRMMRSQMVMQRIAPLVQAAQTKHAGDPMKQREAVMKVYADAGISPFAPLAGCLPMLIPMPVLFALFFVFQNTIEFRGVPFLWFPDISVADPYYIAPLLTGGSMFLLSWLSMRNVPPNPQTKMMAWMMPLMMTIFGINFAAGLNLYWFVQNFAAMPQQWLISNERGKAAVASGTSSAATPTAPADGGARKRR